MAEEFKPPQVGLADLFEPPHLPTVWPPRGARQVWLESNGGDRVLGPVPAEVRAHMKAAAERRAQRRREWRDEHQGYDADRFKNQKATEI